MVVVVVGDRLYLGHLCPLPGWKIKGEGEKWMVGVLLAVSVGLAQVHCVCKSPQ